MKKSKLKRKLKETQLELERTKLDIPLHTIECPNCIEGLIVKIKGRLFCEDCHIEL